MKTSNNYSELTVNGINFVRIENDINGNPRYVVHFLAVFSAIEKRAFRNLSIDQKYELALVKAKKIGGKKYRAKWYGGGIVFQSYNIEETAKFFTETQK